MPSLSQKIATCLNLKAPTSFVVKAGAGAGKTRALVETLNEIPEETFIELSLCKRRIAVITYTNAASDEISRRISLNPLVQVSTIHSFVWELIKHYQKDIKEWMLKDLARSAAEARSKITARSRRDYESDALAYEQKAEELKLSRSKFIYSPTGANVGKNSLQHSHVLKMGGDFLGGNQEDSLRATLCEITIARFPIILIDECQDTQKNLMQAFLRLQQNFSEKFCLGLFGDAMQRIYMDGLPDLYGQIPTTWKSFEIRENNRSPQRIIELINLIRHDADGLVQIPGKNETQGAARFFIFDRNIFDDNGKRMQLEKKVAAIMAGETHDEKWANLESVKRLTLEHKMAARRDGFIELVECFDKLPHSKQHLFSVSSGDSTTPDISEISFFTHRILPLLSSKEEYFLTGFLKKHSQLFDNKKIRRQSGQEIIAVLSQMKQALSELFVLSEDDNDPLLRHILLVVAKYRLFFIPDTLRRALGLELEESENLPPASDEGSEDEDGNDNIQGWVEFLDLPLSQIIKYYRYFKGESSFGTHQGVKGLQFDRVFVVIDDVEARGNQFNYSRLFDSFGSAKDTTDQIERTKRLLYVVCSRSQKSLAVLIYADDVTHMHKSLIDSGLGGVNEIVTICN